MEKISARSIWMHNVISLKPIPSSTLFDCMLALFVFLTIHFGQKYDAALTRWFNNNTQKSGAGEKKKKLNERTINRERERERKGKENRKRNSQKRKVMIIMMMLMLRDDTISMKTQEKIDMGERDWVEKEREREVEVKRNRKTGESFWLILFSAAAKATNIKMKRTKIKRDGNATANMEKWWEQTKRKKIIL